MKEEEIKAVAEKAMMIVCGYAFSQTEEGFIRVVYLHPPISCSCNDKRG